MNSLIQRVDLVLERTLAVLMALLVLDVLWQVFTRFVLQDASSVSEEIARFLLIWISMLGAAYVFGRRQHLAIDLLPNRLTGRSRMRWLTVIDAVVILFALLAMVGGGGRLVWVTLYLGQTSAALGMPLGAVYVAIPLSGALMVLYTATQILERMREGS